MKIIKKDWLINKELQSKITRLQFTIKTNSFDTYIITSVKDPYELERIKIIVHPEKNSTMINNPDKCIGW